jgi:hypothetical protein
LYQRSELFHFEIDRLDFDVIFQLLQRDTRKRLGCEGMGGLQGLKAHPWFADYDWSKIESKEAIPPFAPDVSFLAEFHSSLQSF